MQIPKSFLKVGEGLLWAAIGGAATSTIELKDYFGKWKDYQIDYAHVSQEAAAGAIMGAAMYLRNLASQSGLVPALDQAGAKPGGESPAAKQG